MVNTLVSPTDLTDFPGAPFADALVDAAATEIRNVAGWHIAPEQTDTVTLDGTLQQVLVLPTLKIGTVSEVRDVTGDTAEVLTGWEVRRDSMLYRQVGWPCRLQSIEVDVTHGHPTIPDDLMDVIAEASDAASRSPATSQLSVGSYSESYRTERLLSESIRTGLSQGSWLTLARYKISI